MTLEQQNPFVVGAKVIREYFEASDVWVASDSSLMVGPEAGRLIRAQERLRTLVQPASVKETGE